MKQVNCSRVSSSLSSSSGHTFHLIYIYLFYQHFSQLYIYPSRCINYLYLSFSFYLYIHIKSLFLSLNSHTRTHALHLSRKTISIRPNSHSQFALCISLFGALSILLSLTPSAKQFRSCSSVLTWTIYCDLSVSDSASSFLSNFCFLLDSWISVKFNCAVELHRNLSFSFFLLLYF